MELFEANKQWSTRPKDQRVKSIRELYERSKAYAAMAFEKKNVPAPTLRTEAQDGEVMLVGKGGIPAKLTNWAFGQVAKYAGAPASYLSELPATLAAQNLNHGLANRAKDAIANLLVQKLDAKLDDILVRSLMTDSYSRVWNWEVAERLLDYESQGWRPATPTFRQSGDEESSACYVSDHDMFAFITHPNRMIREEGNEKGLLRGLIAVNSEVGAARVKLIKFLYREMCGNHIIWGAEDVVEMSAVHRGNVRDKMALWQGEIARYMNESAAEDEQKIRTAKSKVIAATKDEVLDALFGKRSLLLSRKALEAGYDAVVEEEDGNANSYWGMAQGLTRSSQETPFADERTKLDTAAGKLIQMAF